MIKFELLITPKWLDLRVRGHDTAETADFHAVCGMVSAVSQTCAYGLQRYCKGNIMEYEPGRLRVKARNLPTARAMCLSCIKGLNAIKQQFPADFEE